MDAHIYYWFRLFIYLFKFVYRPQYTGNIIKLENEPPVRFERASPLIQHAFEPFGHEVRRSSSKVE